MKRDLNDILREEGIEALRAKLGSAPTIDQDAYGYGDGFNGPLPDDYGDTTTTPADYAPQLRIINPADWEGVPVPTREWIVPDWIPARTVTLLFGDGGAGKTTLALQLAVARALARDWITTMPTPGRTLVLSAEDDDREMHRRVDAIRTHYGVTFADLADMRLIDLVGENAVLGELARNGIINPTKLLAAVVAEIEQFRPSQVIVDALADTFAGDENNRTQARQFIALLKGPARDYDCAFLVLAHPSLSGLNTGRGTSGSTAWSNSVRSRLYFAPAQASDGSEPDPDLRILSVAKANYAPTGTTITLRWKAGVYVPVPGMASLDRLAQEAKADDVFIQLLIRFNRSNETSPTKRARHMRRPSSRASPRRRRTESTAKSSPLPWCGCSKATASSFKPTGHRPENGIGSLLEGDPMLPPPFHRPSTALPPGVFPLPPYPLAVEPPPPVEGVGGSTFFEARGMPHTLTGATRR
jgi:RecA-family ATPase